MPYPVLTTNADEYLSSSGFAIPEGYFAVSFDLYDADTGEFLNRVSKLNLP